MQHDTIRCRLWPQKAKTPPTYRWGKAAETQHTTLCFPRELEKPHRCSQGNTAPRQVHFSLSAPQGQEPRAPGMEPAPHPASIPGKAAKSHPRQGAAEPVGKQEAALGSPPQPSHKPHKCPSPTLHSSSTPQHCQDRECWASPRINTPKA